MVRIAGEIVSTSSGGGVEFVADERNEPATTHTCASELISTGPIGLGTRFRAEMSRMGRTTEMITEFTGYERPHRLASSTHCPPWRSRPT